MNETLIHIKRLLLSGHYAFSFKAETELLGDDLTAEDAIEAVMNAPAITKVLKSRSPRRTTAREKLYVIVGSTYDGLLIYISSKRWTDEAED